MRPLSTRQFLSFPPLPYKAGERKLLHVTAPFTRKTLTRDAIVVGCGVAGLTTAVRLLEAGFRVRIATRERTPHTTSDVAAAVWYPFRCGPPDRALLWSRRSFRAFRELSRDVATGVTMVEGIDLKETAGGIDPWWREAVDAFRPAEPSELRPGHVAGFVFSAPVIAMPVYLKWLEERVLALKGTIETRSVGQLEPLFLEASLIVNCTGLAARELTRGAVEVVRGVVDGIRSASRRTEASADSCMYGAAEVNAPAANERYASLAAPRSSWNFPRSNHDHGTSRPTTVSARRRSMASWMDDRYRATTAADEDRSISYSRRLPSAYGSEGSISMTDRYRSRARSSAIPLHVPASATRASVSPASAA
jgi:glycine/D-amino acid oxidase-like deaminating enzyme